MLSLNQSQFSQQWSVCRQTRAVCKPITYLYSSTKQRRISTKNYIFSIELRIFPTFTCQYFLFMTLEPVDYSEQIIMKAEINAHRVFQHFQSTPDLKARNKSFVMKTKKKLKVKIRKVLIVFHRHSG